MQLPASLQTAIEQAALGIPISALREAYSKLSERYRRGEDSGTVFRSKEQILAYLLARMPATYAAVFKALESVKERMPEWNCQSILDLGAGPGTACWAANEIFATLNQFYLYEKSPEVIAIGRQLASSSDSLSLKNSQWTEQDLTRPFEIPRADLTILSYVLGETEIFNLIDKIWKQGTVLVLVEPGTPKGFSQILAVRKKLIELGAYIIAPCPHHHECPASGWCHFPARIERTKIHRTLKDGALGYEDEKFSYLAASPFPLLPLEGRVIDNPLKLSGHVKLTVCTKAGTLEKKTITRKQKELYKRARDAEWSSSWQM